MLRHYVSNYHHMVLLFCRCELVGWLNHPLWYYVFLTCGFHERENIYLKHSRCIGGYNIPYETYMLNFLEHLWNTFRNTFWITSNIVKIPDIPSICLFPSCCSGFDYGIGTSFTRLNILSDKINNQLRFFNGTISSLCKIEVGNLYPYYVKERIHTRHTIKESFAIHCLV